MDKLLVLGAEAIAVAALDEGISGVYAYPGTPSTEITEYIQKNSDSKLVHSNWSSNEKTAYEAALGMSYCGKRSLVCMKHVGLNVAADAFMNSAITGIHGGLVVVVADDPSMHSSQNEQDTRFYGKFSYLPLLEPSNQQEVYDSVRWAFGFSETVKLPVILRITTRLSHSRASVLRTETAPQNKLNPETDRMKWVLLPANARKRYANLLDMQQTLVRHSEQSAFNKRIDGTGTKGILAFGIAYNYVMEAQQQYNLNIPVLKISHYPLPHSLVKEFCEQHEQVLIAEEGYPVYEEWLRGYFDNSKFQGRLDGTLPRMGELTPDSVAKALGFETPASTTTGTIPQRPPRLCDGCSHRDLFDAMNEVLAGYEHQHVFGDIGCYTLGALPPYNAIHTCVDMGASVTMAKGASDAGLHPAVCVIGDSTFTHSGITGLLDAVNDGSKVTVIISDNYTTAMTGGQDSAGTNRLQAICEGIGVDPDHIRTFIPLRKNHDEAVQLLKEEFEYPGVSVILATRECVQTALRKKKNSKK